MDKLLINLSEHLNSFKLLFAGFHLESNSGEIEEITKGVKDLNIYSPAKDRQNLKQDRDNIGKDLIKAYQEKELELS